MSLYNAKYLFRLCLLIIAGLLISSSTSATSPSFPDNSFALYAMSRVSGVLAPTREAVQRVRFLLEEARQRGEVLSLVHTQIGYEGATRLCATFATPDAARAAWEQARLFTEGVELINLVVEPCDEQ